MLLAVYALCVHGCRICIYSPGARASGNEDGMLSTIRRFLTEVFGIEKFYKSNAEHLFIEVKEGDIREIRAFPSSKTGCVKIIKKSCNHYNP
jgi:hypothetical protein